jgi:tetratricopeptide (TPR) repeat protein
MADKPRLPRKKPAIKTTKTFKQKILAGTTAKASFIGMINKTTRPQKAIAILLFICLIVVLMLGWQGGFKSKDKITPANSTDNQASFINNDYGVPQLIVDSLFKNMAEKGVKPQDSARIMANAIQKYKALETQLTDRNDHFSKQALSLLTKNNLAETEQLFKQAQEQNFTATNAFYLAQLNVVELNYAEAKGYYRQAVQLDPENALYLNDLGIHLYNLGEYDAAEAAYLKSLAIKEKLLGKNHPLIAENLNNLAVLYQSQGDYAKAEVLQQRSLVIDKKALNQEPSYLTLLYQSSDDDSEDNGQYSLVDLGSNNNVLGRFARDLNNLAMLNKAQGKYAEAEPLLLRSIGIKEKNLGKNNFQVGNSFSNLKNLYQSKTDYQANEKLLLRSIAAKEKELGKQHLSVADSLNNLANFYKTQSEYAKAQPLLVRSIAIKEKNLGEEHPNVAMDLNNLALLYQAQGQSAKSESLLLRSVGILEKTFGKDSPQLAPILNNLSFVYQKQGKPVEAELLLARSVTILEKTLGKNHPNTKAVSDNLQELRTHKK